MVDYFLLTTSYHELSDFLNLKIYSYPRKEPEDPGSYVCVLENIKNFN